MNKNFLIFLLSLLAAMPLQAERVDSVQQNFIVDKRLSAGDASDFLGTGSRSFAINLPPVQADLTLSDSGARKTGIVYRLPAQVTASQLSWERVGGGYAARIHLFSDQAKRLRYHLVFDQEIPSIEFRLRGDKDASAIGPIDYTFIHENEIWLPITNGNSADLEIFVNETERPEELDFAIDAINEIFDDLNRSKGPGIKAKSLGLTEEDEIDLACFADTIYYPALEQAAKATTKINFIKNGFSFTCTGTLLADRGGTQTPWLATANHCISDQATANTASFEWFFQAKSCGGSATDSRYAQTSGGAQLLWTNFNLDASFFRLNSHPPNGVVFSGWETDIQVGDLVWGVHHPQGDHTMVSVGFVTALLQPVIESDTKASHLVNHIDFIYGNTEVGSSGSGLFSVSNDSAYWKGTLFGGPEDDPQAASYSNFNSYYISIKPWLENTSTLSDNIECLLDWAENAYPNLFSPAGAISQFQSPYTYRYYSITNAYVGVSINNHVYYLGPSGRLEDVGALPGWLTTAKCQ